jgi:hypothetical protein
MCYSFFGINPIFPYLFKQRIKAVDIDRFIAEKKTTCIIIKQGQNKITAKFSCGNNSRISHNSMNVTGVANSNPAINASGLQRVSSPNYNNPNKGDLLLISLGLEKNPISIGDKETFKIRMIDAANLNVTIAGASVNGTVTESKNTTKTNFNGSTDKSGIFTHIENKQRL